MCSTLPTSNVIRTGCSNVIRIGHSVVKSGKTAKVVSTVGRPTGIMVRPVKYVRVQ